MGRPAQKQEMLKICVIRDNHEANIEMLTVKIKESQPKVSVELRNEGIS